MEPKFEATRPVKGIGALMIGMVTAQELHANPGDVKSGSRTCSEWIDGFIAEIERDFLKPEHAALLEVVAPDGAVLDHLDGRSLNPGHAIECAWFIMHEGRLRGDRRLIALGTRILDWMWTLGWDAAHGGLLYFTGLHGKPVQEYWHDMKFWWPHCEAVIATLLAWKLTSLRAHLVRRAGEPQGGPEERRQPRAGPGLLRGICPALQGRARSLPPLPIPDIRRLCPSPGSRSFFSPPFSLRGRSRCSSMSSTTTTPAPMQTRESKLPVRQERR